MSTETLQWGVIGCGAVLENKSGPALHCADRSEIRAVMSRGGSSAKAYASAHDIPIATDDASQVLMDPEIDVVYVATPPDSHREYTKDAAEIGKNVLVEKPMGLSVADGKAMIEACDQAGVELFVAYYRRFHPQIQRMKQLLQENAIGKPVRAYINFAFPTPEDSGWRETPEISGGGWFVDATVHKIDAMVYLLGPPDEVSGTVLSIEEGKVVEDVVSLNIRFENDILCTVISDFYSGESTDVFQIFGTKGHIKADELDDGTFEFDTEDMSGKLSFEMPSAAHSGLIQHVERVLLDDKDSHCSGRSALLTEAILDNGVRSTYADALPSDRWSGLHDISALHSS